MNKSDTPTFQVNTAPNFAMSGVVATSVGSNGSIAVSVTVQADGKILLGGTSNRDLGFSDFALVRYNTDGSLDLSFNSDGKVTTALSDQFEWLHRHH